MSNGGEQMRASILALTMCSAFFAFSVLAEEQQKSAHLIQLSCTPDRCENWHYDIGTTISMTTDCITHELPKELLFPSHNGTHIKEIKTANAQLVTEVTDIAVHQTFNWGTDGIRNLSYILVSRIDGKYNETREAFTKFGTDKTKINGTCLSASELTKRKF